jgi:hypothetical protein
MHMLSHGTSENSTRGQRLALHGLWIIHEEFNSDGREPRGGGPRVPYDGASVAKKNFAP